jgi:hypothetical protein
LIEILLGKTKVLFFIVYVLLKEAEYFICYYQKSTR